MTKIHCENWDSNKPEYLTDVRTGRTVGRLMPRIDQPTLEASADIRQWSKPGAKFVVTQYDPSSVASFAAHWERVYGKTYPLAVKNSGDSEPT